jgi:hypothetical protein
LNFNLLCNKTMFEFIKINIWFNRCSVLFSITVIWMIVIWMIVIWITIK